MKFKKLEISEKVIQRLTEYLSILKDVQKYENEINSIELSKIMNTTSAQVRKDLSTFGDFGVRGKGYDISKLIEIIEDILGINKVNNVIIVGHGKMGEMISSNRNVLGKGFQIVGIFDKDKNKIGKVVSDNLEIRDVNDVKEFRENFCGEVDTAILAVVKEQAQFAAEQLVKNGIKAILNMTTYKLELGSDITVVNIDISAKLQELNFWRLNKEEK
ncbi:MAG: redox-sensing transcriptional repressor Rex [Leptotrichia sp.]|uniref:redox-sensing transcriptional repressor Rex n=1 Tax=unclassified Leptotrichia TaxID=2633022 RepID=UPI0007680154|nr:MULTISPECIES: redox-sensing transcriptional repressor Rex [unclassified Leptotrichia]AMD94758.1 redox-sensing transcriptional repressor Rex [Leptotrichia sp. oral taxon 847]ASQ48352.1 redox-sensing transcriptional repressor Rex [Leptotrichia sp. oral taxon 498]RKW35242.1 MAG: redox-sensing transcriptional repressor Rex [Leptotrichia sp.]